MYKIAVIIPTYNPGYHAKEMIDALMNQSIEIYKVVIVDSSSNDGSTELWKNAGFELITIKKADFDHGASRNLGAHAVMDCDVLVFMTQDAVPGDRKTLEQLVDPIISGRVDALYARQIARPEASYIEKITREYNYPNIPEEKFVVKTNSAKVNSVRMYFFSNVCSAYRREAFESVGGFEEGVILNEDVIICKKMIDAGYLVGYNSESTVIHSHEYTVKKDFLRSFDIGVSHSDVASLRTLNSEGEGLKYVKFVLKNLYINKKILIPKFISHSFARYIGYFLGKNHRILGARLSKHLSMHKGYWMQAKGEH